jgi:hypothetical protein
VVEEKFITNEIMKNRQQLSDNLPPGDNRSRRIQLPQRDSVTNLQVSTLLNVVMTLTGVLLNPTRENDDPNWRDRKKLDGGALAAAETTFINVCSRIDEILADKTRWNFEAQNQLESEIAKVYQQQRLALKAQTEATEEISSPHRQYNPKLVKLSDSSWIAILGDENNLDNAIVGVGYSPAEALAAFDGMFKGDLPDSVAHWLAEHEAMEITEKQKQNEDKTVGKRRDRTLRNSKKPRRESGPNSRNTDDDGPDAGSDSEQTPGSESPEGSGS